MPPRIAILGAGPAGLTFARLLSKQYIDFVVFERDETATWPEGRGYSGCLDIHGDSGQLALKEAGLLEAFKPLARYDAKTVIADPTGQIVIGDEGMQAMGDDGGRPEIDRTDLRRLLLDSVPAEKIRWDSKVQRVERDAKDGSMSVHLVNGGVESGFELVVGADGAWSKARSLVTSAKPQYAGKQYLTTKIEPTNPYHSTAAKLAGAGNYLVLGGGKMLIIMKLGDDSYYFGVGLQMPEDWCTNNASLLADPAASRDWLLREHFSSWSTTHKDLILHSSDSPLRPWPLYALNLDAMTWDSVPGIALIGDAAHMNVPDGEGVNRALMDALQLSQEIAKHGLENLDAAVQEFEAEMLPRTRAALVEGQPMTDVFFAENAAHDLAKIFASFGEGAESGGEGAGGESKGDVQQHTSKQAEVAAA